MKQNIQIKHKPRKRAPTSIDVHKRNNPLTWMDTLEHGLKKTKILIFLLIEIVLLALAGMTIYENHKQPDRSLSLLGIRSAIQVQSKSSYRGLAARSF